jgi:hypothetical protein
MCIESSPRRNSITPCLAIASRQHTHSLPCMMIFQISIPSSLSMPSGRKYFNQNTFLRPCIEIARTNWIFHAFARRGERRKHKNAPAPHTRSLTLAGWKATEHTCIIIIIMQPKRNPLAIKFSRFNQKAFSFRTNPTRFCIPCLLLFFTSIGVQSRSSSRRLHSSYVMNVFLSTEGCCALNKLPFSGQFHGGRGRRNPCWKNIYTDLSSNPVQCSCIYTFSVSITICYFSCCCHGILKCRKVTMESNHCSFQLRSLIL